jgi:hypothetical protein
MPAVFFDVLRTDDAALWLKQHVDPYALIARPLASSLLLFALAGPALAETPYDGV